MDYDRSDSSGTADDLPPSHHNRFVRGSQVTRNGRNAVLGASSYAGVHDDMETQIHQLEQEAYSSVLRAFKAQSDAITWEKESLMTELRKELRVSDDDHRELLGRVNADDIIWRIREWRQVGGAQSGLLNASQNIHDAIPSPTVSASCRKKKSSHSLTSLSLGTPSPALHQKTLAFPMQSSPSVPNRGAVLGGKGKKPKSNQTLPAVLSMKSTQYPSTGPTGRAHIPNRGSSGAVVVTEPAEGANLIGRKVLTRWPADKNFYEAVIHEYNPAEGTHALVYDIHRENETWEWVNLAEIPEEDIRWKGEDPGISHRIGSSGHGSGGVKKSGSRSGAGPGIARGKGGSKNLTKKDFLTSQNGIGKKGFDDIEILHTDTVIKEVEKIFGASHLDPIEMEKARKVLKDHEQALLYAIARLADASDGDSDGEHHFSLGQSMEGERGWKSRHYGSSNKHGGGRSGGLDREGQVASDDQKDGDGGDDDI